MASRWRWGLMVIAVVVAGKTLSNVVTVLYRAEPGGGSFRLKSLVLTLEAEPAHDLLQITEATFRDVEMIRFGPLSGAGQANGVGSFGHALPGHLVVDSLNDLDVRIDKCRSLDLRPGEEADHRGAVTLTVDVGDCVASLLAVELRHRDGSPSVLAALGVSGEGTLANADFVLERPSNFSLVFKGPEKRALFDPLPKAVAMRLELARDEQTWKVERGLFRRCECKGGDVVDLGGPLSLEALHMEAGELKAKIKLSEGSAISCGPAGASCGFNSDLFNPGEMIDAVLGALGA